MSDWIGNQNSIYKTLGASSHTKEQRQQDDYYATDPRSIDYLLEKATPQKDIWECACGEGHLSKRLMELGFNVRSTDLVYRGFGSGGGWASSVFMHLSRAISLQTRLTNMQKNLWSTPLRSYSPAAAPICF